MKRILVIDDEEMILEVMKTVIEPMGYHVETSSDSTLGLRRAVDESWELVVVDLRMPTTNGADIVEAVIAAKPDQRILIATGYPNDSLASRALESGAVALLRKPFEIAKILNFVEA